MFEKSKDSGHRSITRIDSGTEIFGDVVFRGMIQLSGRVKGNLIAVEEAGSQLVVDDQGSVEGEVRAGKITLHGKIVGDIFASERIDLHPKAQVFGTIHYRAIEIARGAEIHGPLVRME